jgi:hypothetical protein
VKKVFVVLALVLAVLLFGCTQQYSSSQQDSSSFLTSPLKVGSGGFTTTQKNAIDLCVASCSSAIANHTDLINGPCLGVIQDDWVCDVAHSPRQAVDNLLENQCADYRTGNAHHFVEVDENCNVITVR